MPHPMDRTPAKPTFSAGDRFRVTQTGGDVWSDVELVDNKLAPGHAWDVKIVDDSMGLDEIPENLRALTLTEEFLSQPFVTKLQP